MAALVLEDIACQGAEFNRRNSLPHSWCNAGRVFLHLLGLLAFGLPSWARWPVVTQLSPAGEDATEALGEGLAVEVLEVFVRC